jgi:hypothetical protein
MFNVDDLLAVAMLPSDRNADWLRGAASAVDYLVKNMHSGEVIIYTNAGQALTHSVLAPRAGVTPPDGDVLQQTQIDPYAHWALEHVSGGGQPDRMYLSPPVDSYGCKALEGAEQLVFRRQFTGVDKGPPRTELSQPLVQALDLYWLDEESAYCKLDEDGDVEPVIRLRDLSTQTNEPGAMLVTIKAEALHRYMAVTETVLVTRFDFTRFITGSFGGWGEPTRSEVNEDDLFYHGGIQANGSFVNGALILRPVLTKAMLIGKARRNWDQADKQYAVFKAHDWKNDNLAEISCAPSDLASYFEPDSPLPFQTTPAFFRPDVLLKYKSDPEKYRLEHRSIHARGGWYLKTYDVNEAGQVHTYLRYLADLPYKEQLYWQSFNEWPKAPISRRAKQTDFDGDFSTEPDPLEHVKYEISKLDGLKPAYWQPRGEALRQAVHYPLTASVEEWSNAILALDQLVVEGFATKPLRKRLTDAGRTFDKQWGTLKLLQDVLIAGGLDEDEAADIMIPLRSTHELRSKTKGHAAESEKAALVKKAKTDHGSLPAHFRALVTSIQESFDRLIELL